MLTLAWPWLVLLLPLPWLLRRGLPPATAGTAMALKVPPALVRAAQPASPSRFSGRRAALGLAALAWGLLVLAACRPQWVGEPVSLPVSGRDLLLAVDLSGSMEMQDFQLGGRWVDRLTATKAVAGEFIERRRGDRLGLILFGRQAYLQAPLTFDRATVQVLLQEAAIGLAGQETAIGDAIGLGIKRLRESDGDSKVLILLTDGANTAGKVTPLKAAELAREAGLKIYTIGIGADEVWRQTIWGQPRVRINPSLELDEETLQRIADTTGGVYFRARDLNELQNIYARLDEMEPVERERRQYRPRQEWFHWPLGGALLLTMLGLAWRLWRGRA